MFICIGPKVIPKDIWLFSNQTALESYQKQPTVYWYIPLNYHPNDISWVRWEKVTRPYSLMIYTTKTIECHSCWAVSGAWTLEQKASAGEKMLLTHPSTEQVVVQSKKNLIRNADFDLCGLQRRQVDPTIVVFRETKVPKVHSRRMGYPRWVFLRTGRTLCLSLLNKRSIKLNKKRFKMTVKKGSSHNISLSCGSVCHRIWMIDVHLSEKVIGHSNGNPSEAS